MALRQVAQVAKEADIDLILTGGKVITMDSGNRLAEAVAIENGKIRAVGSNAEILEKTGTDTKIEHLSGRTLLPGFIDPHNHFSLTSFQPASVDCSVPPLRDVQGVLDAVAQAAKGAPTGQLVWGWGFGSRFLGGAHLSRWDLDEATPNNPVCVVDTSVHACYATLRRSG